MRISAISLLLVFVVAAVVAMLTIKFWLLAETQPNTTTYRVSVYYHNGDSGDLIYEGIRDVFVRNGAVHFRRHLMEPYTIIVPGSARIEVRPERQKSVGNGVEK